jgi:glycosyltransferase involved in cell wall biosynthesis
MNSKLVDETMPVLRDCRVALVHYWLVRRRGGERVLEALAELFPQADIFTLIMDPKSLGGTLPGRKIYTSFLQRLPGIHRHYQKLLPLVPLALESFNLQGYDLVISSESGPAKGVITGSRTCHICYCHTPMRYLWDMYFDYRDSAGGGALGRLGFSVVSHYLRLWDHASASRVDHFVANSHNVAARIWKTYRRSAEVIYPPVEVDEFCAVDQPGEFYLFVGQLLPYKRADLAIEACNQLGRRLFVIGEGDELNRLQSIAGPTVTILGWQSLEVIRDYYRRCRALLFPGEEDFGLTAVEAQASGRPVIAFGRGGALESVRGYFANDWPSFTEPTGVFFEEDSVKSLTAAILEFERNEERFSPMAIRKHAERFSAKRFRLEMSVFLNAKSEKLLLKQHRTSESLSLAIQ